MSAIVLKARCAFGHLRLKCGVWQRTVALFLGMLLWNGSLVTGVVAESPEAVIDEQGVRLKGVGPDNPIIYDNDWWFDVFDNNYLWAQASLGHVQLRGNIVSRDMWDWEKGYLYSPEDCIEDARKSLQLARAAGLRKLPDITRGADRVLVRPLSGQIEETVQHPSDGSRLIVTEAKKATPEKPLLVIAGGPLTTVANALLSNPEIAPNLIVFNLMVSNYNYNGKDAWSAYVVAKQARYVDWGGGQFWDRDSVFVAADFDLLPDNSFTTEMKRFIRTDLGRDNQLGDGAPLVWLFEPKCWTDVVRMRANFDGKALAFSSIQGDEPGDVLVIPKSATALDLCRKEFLRVLTDPDLFKSPGKP